MLGGGAMGKKGAMPEPEVRRSESVVARLQKRGWDDAPLSLYWPYFSMAHIAVGARLWVGEEFNGRVRVRGQQHNIIRKGGG